MERAGSNGPRWRGWVTRIGSAVVRRLVRFGLAGESVVKHAGGLGILVWDTVGVVVRRRVPASEFIAQLFDMGVRSMPLVGVVAVLAGVVTSQQGGYQFTGSIPLYILGSVVSSSIVLELGPVLTAVVFIGRVGARITAEIGSMQVSEQVDALHALGRDPVRMLAAPRILSGIIALPLLVGMADFIGVYSGMLAARSTLKLGPESFFYGARLFWHSWDLFYSITKGVTFGFMVPLIAVHMGLRTSGGAEGVGRTTNSSVVFMTVAVLTMDALFPPLLLGR
jgi:phospholipid/cholesterol/gamma-HCH transport system permease protein